MTSEQIVKTEHRRKSFVEENTKKLPYM